MVSALILLLIILPLTLSLLLDIPAVQNFIVHKAAGFASRKLETRVEIDRVNIGLLNRICVYGFYVEDYQRDTLLYVGELRTLVTGVGLFGEGLSFAYGDLRDAKLFLKETPEGVMNIKQVVDRLSRRNGKGNFRLSMHRVDVAGLELRIEQQRHRNPDYGVDYGNMRLRDMSGRVDNLAIVGGAVSGEIEGLSFRELSGFEAAGISGAFTVDKGVITLDDARIRTAKSDVGIRSLTLSGDGWAAYKDFISNVEIDIDAAESVLSSDDVGYFAPAIARWNTRLGDLSLTMKGTVDNFSGRIPGVSIDGCTTLSATVSAKGLPDYKNTDFVIDIDNLRTDAAEVRHLAADIAGRELPPAVADVLRRAGRVGLSGNFRGRLSSFSTRGRLTTDEGNVRFAATMHPDAEPTRALTAKVASHGIDLGRLLGQKMLGEAEFTVSTEGTLGGGTCNLAVDGDIRRLRVGSYACDSIKVDGRVDDGNVLAAVAVRDRSLNLDLDAAVSTDGETPFYDMVMELHRADLAAMGINRRDSVSVLSASVGLTAAGRIPDDVNGGISVANAIYRYDDKEVTSEYMSIKVGSNEDTRSVNLVSDFADATFESRNDYRQVWQYLKTIIGNYLPLLYEEGEVAVAGQDRDREGHDETERHSLSVLSLTAKNLDPIADAVSRGLEIAEGSHLRVMLDPACDRFVMHGSTDYIERNSLLGMGLRMDISNDGDSLAMKLNAADFYWGTFHLPDLKLNASARDNRVMLAGDFSDTLRSFSGFLGMTARLRKNPGTNTRGVDLMFQPSFIATKNNRWELSANNIAADSSRVVIDRFSIRNSRQELSVDGVASRSRNDSLTLRLRDFDLAPLLQVADRLGYSIEGRSNGFATVKSALRESEIVANILLDSIEVNTVPVRPLVLGSKWDFEQNRARLAVSTLAERDTVMRGFYIPSQVRYFVRMDVDSLDMALLNPLLSGVISGTRGVARTDLTLEGERRTATLRGDIAVRDLSTTVDFTQVTYTVPEAHIAVDNNRLTVGDVEVFDNEGRSGRMSFDLSLNHLSNISYTLNVLPDRMLVLNTSARDNDYFYGKVYASGAATITGDRSGVNMDIVAATDDNSEFYMPLSNSSDVATADFVTFEQANKPDTTNFLVRKKMMFENRQRQRDSEAGRLDINMALDVRPNAMVQLVIDPTVGDIIKGRGEGSMNIHVNPKANIFEMYGDYTIADGSYLFTLQNIINKKFIIEEGSSIHWTGEPLDALLNIDAVYKLKASLQPLLEGSVSSNIPTRAVPVECIIHLSDRLTNPTVTFDVVVPNADPDVQSLVANALSTPESRSQQFLYLLVANSFISEASADISGTLGATASAATGFELLSNQLSNWLSADTYNIVIRYRPKTEMTSDEVDIGFSTELVSNRLLLEVEGNYLVDRSMAVNQTSNLMGEAYLTWLIDRAGNLRLKGFTHTIDRFDENQGLQETGIGIYYKESFNNLKDLKQRVKDRFATRREKKNRREKRNRKKDGAENGSAVTDDNENEEETDKNN